MAGIPQDASNGARSLRSTPSLEAVEELRAAMLKQRETIIQPTELARLKISLSKFDPYDDAQLNANDFFFRAMPQHELADYPIVLQRGHFNRNSYLELREYDPKKAQESAFKGLDRPYLRALEIKDYFRGQLFSLLRKNIVKGNTKGTGVLADVMRWKPIPLNDPSRFDDRILSGLRSQNRYEWQTHYVWEYSSGEDRGMEVSLTHAMPHILALTLHDADGEDGKLLLGEMAAVAEVIHERMTRHEFEDTDLFPVLLVSLFGPRHGRILHAHYNSSGTLLVKASKCFSFLKVEYAPIDLFLRFFLSEPRIGLGTYLPRQPEVELPLKQETDQPLQTKTELPVRTISSALAPKVNQANSGESLVSRKKKRRNKSKKAQAPASPPSEKESRI